MYFSGLLRASAAAYGTPMVRPGPKEIEMGCTLEKVRTMTADRQPVRVEWEEPSWTGL